MAKKPITAKTKDLEVIDIHLTRISISKSNPRKSLDTNAIGYLAESMEEHGLLQPITVRPVDDNYEIVAGERRYRAAKQLNWITIPAIVREVTNDEMLEVQVLENLQREDINPIDEAAAFQTLIKKEDIEWLAARIHKSTRYVQDRLKLNNLSRLGKILLSKGHLPLSHAVLISKLTPEYQVKALDLCFPYIDFTDDTEYQWEEEDLICKVTVNELKESVNDFFAYFHMAKFDPADKFLNKEAGACTECPHRTTNNLLLFADITHEDRCTLASCFNAKNEQQVINNIEQAKRLHKGIKEGSVDFNARVKVGGKLIDEYSDKPAKGLTPIVITKADSFREKAVGQVVYVDLSEAKEKKVNKLAPAEPDVFNPDDYKERLDIYMSEKYPLMRRYYEHIAPPESGTALIKDIIKSKLKQCATEELYIMASIAKVIDLKPEAAYIESQRVSELGYQACREAETDLIEKIANELTTSEMARLFHIANWIEDIESIDDPETWAESELNKFLQTIKFKA